VGWLRITIALFLFSKTKNNQVGVFVDFFLAVAPNKADSLLPDLFNKAPPFFPWFSWKRLHWWAGGLADKLPKILRRLVRPLVVLLF
jgi:hypothetical protein